MSSAAARCIPLLYSDFSEKLPTILSVRIN